MMTSDALADALIAKATEIGALTAGMADDSVPYSHFRDEAADMLQRNGFHPAVAALLADEYARTIARVKAAYESVAPAQTSGGIH